MEVEVDAVPSPARSAQGPTESSEPVEDKPQVEPGEGTPSSPKRNLRAEAGSSKNKSTSSCNLSPQSEQKSNHKKEPIYKSKCQNSSRVQGMHFGKVVLNGCFNTVVGTVKTNNFYPLSVSKEVQSKKCDDNSTISKDEKKLLCDLQTCVKPVDSDDILIVSEHLTVDGLKNLAQNLGIDEHDIYKQLLEDYKNDRRELTSQTLLLWTDLFKKAAMVNVLCVQLSFIRDNGGKSALKQLHIRHFSS